VVLFSFWAPLYGSSERVYTQAVLPEAEILPEPPDLRQPDMERVWDAAIAKDFWPDLAIHGKTGTSGRRIAGGHPENVLQGIVRADERGRKGERDQVLLLHDINRQTANALPQIIGHYERSGRRFAAVAELMLDTRITATCSFASPASWSPARQ
jgi:peptidoglycan/xylan/chitin deacetylase (PgdA/CDA1 family)